MSIFYQISIFLRFIFTHVAVKFSKDISVKVSFIFIITQIFFGDLCYEGSWTKIVYLGTIYISL